jgi:hypothetical protein
VIDHVIVDVIAAVRGALEDALLERQAVEERFQVDVFLGDLSWETSYSLPGEGAPPRVRADVSIDWPTWSQSIYRSWTLGESTEDLPEVVVEVALRIQRLAVPVDPQEALKALTIPPPAIGGDSLERLGPTLEQSYDDGKPSGASPDRCAVEIGYEGSIHLSEEMLSDAEVIDRQFAPLGRWIASCLVRLGDLDLPFLPPEEEASDEG